MFNHLSFIGRGLAISAAVAMGLMFAQAAQAANMFAMNLSFSEALLAAYGTPEQAAVEHYEAWDSPQKRIAKRNMPFIELTNTSNMADLTQFQMTIEMPEFEFGDDVFGSYAKLGVTTPDIAITSSSPDDGSTLIVNFTDGLQPGETVRFQVDIDVDAAYPDLYPHPDYRMVFFELDGSNTSDNSVVTTYFSMGPSISVKLQDFENPLPNPPYLNGGPVRSYNNMDGVERFEVNGQIPEPATGLLALIGLGCCAAFRGRV